MQAFHNDVTIKAKYLARVEAHRIADEIVQGVGYERNGQVRACAVGCTLDVYDHKRYPIELGIPEWLARLEDAIHEGVPLARAKLWPGQFLDAVPVGVDLEPVQWQLTIARMERLLPPLAENKEDYARQCEAAIQGVISMARGFLKDGFDESAANAAWSAARSAESAASAAWSAARSAASAASAESAARSAESAARSAASAARSAASAARSAASAARSAAYELEADTLLAILRAAK